MEKSRRVKFWNLKEWPQNQKHVNQQKAEQGRWKKVWKNQRKCGGFYSLPRCLYRKLRLAKAYSRQLCVFSKIFGSPPLFFFFLLFFSFEKVYKCLTIYFPKHLKIKTVFIISIMSNLLNVLISLNIKVQTTETAFEKAFALRHHLF